MSDLQPDEAATRICRKCSVASTHAAGFCPACGTPYARGSRRPSRKLLLIGALVLVLLAGTAAAVGVKQHRDAVADERASTAEAREDLRAADAAAEAQEEDAKAERSLRRDLVEALENQITKDAKEKADDDLLEGPILYSTCTATGGGSTDDLTALTGTFDCMAVNTENDDGTASGYRYSGTAEWDTGSISWHLGG